MSTDSLQFEKKKSKKHPGYNFLWQWHCHPDFWITLGKQKWDEFQCRAGVNLISVIPIMNFKALLWTLCFHRCYIQNLGLTNAQLITTQLIPFAFCMGIAKRIEIKGLVDVSGTRSVPEGAGIPRGNSTCWLQESNRTFLLGFLYLFTGELDQINKFQDTARSWWWWTRNCSGKTAGNPQKAQLWPNCADLATIKSLLGSAAEENQGKISCFLPIRDIMECRYENAIYGDTHFKMLWGRCCLICVYTTTARNPFAQIGILLFAPCLNLA